MPVERAAGGTSLIDVLDRVLDKGIVIDAWVRVSLVGIDLITVEARVVVASIDTYLKYSEAVGRPRPSAGRRSRRSRMRKSLPKMPRSEPSSRVPSLPAAYPGRSVGPRRALTATAAFRHRSSPPSCRRTARVAPASARGLSQPHGSRRLRAARAAVACRRPCTSTVALSRRPAGQQTSSPSAGTG
jgi:hypothetical protein